MRYIWPKRGKKAVADEKAAAHGRILVVEDSHCVQLSIKMLLKRMNFDADIAADGRMACEMAEKSKADGKPYDLVLMDMQMPNMNGWEAASWLRSHKWEGPIIAVSVYSLPEDHEKFVEAGCDDYLTKPVTEAALRDALDQYLP